MSDDILGMEASFEADALRKKVSELEKEIMRLQQIIRDEDLDIDDIPEMSDEEYICLQQIGKLKDQSDGMAFDQEQAKIFDTLVKDLNIIRNGNPRKKAKNKTQAEVADLLSIARGES
jgi:hypothetical protein